VLSLVEASGVAIFFRKGTMGTYNEMAKDIMDMRSMISIPF
jgi:hypothetical protein